MKRIFALLTLVSLAACKTLPHGEEDKSASRTDAGAWFSIPAPDKPIPLKFFPSSAPGQSPSVFLVHGSNGPDIRQDHWARFFNEQGYNALIIDLKTGRFSGPEDRARLYPFPLIERAHAWLVQQATVDPQRIIWMGFSLGATLGMMTEQPPWSGFILFYPGCWSFTKTQQPKPPQYLAFHAERPRIRPTLVLWGKSDAYEENRYCPEMIKLMSGPVETLAIDQAHHGFDGNLTISFRDPPSPSGMASLMPNPEARRTAEDKVREFLRLPK